MTGCVFAWPGIAAAEPARDGTSVDSAQSSIFARLSVDEQRRRSAALLAGGKRVTFQDVLRDPDNVALNIAYARRQIADRDLLGASATLERVLLIAPGNLLARLLYGVTLYRLGSNIEAEKHLRIVLKFRLPPRLRNEIEIYLDDIVHRKQQTRGQLFVFSGVQFDTNRNVGPDGGLVETTVGTVPLTGRNRAKSDWGLTTIARVRIDHDLKMARRHRVFAEFGLYRTDQRTLHQFSFQAIDVALGAIVDFGVWNLKPEIFLQYTTLSHEFLSRAFGGRLTGHYLLNRNTDVFAWGSAATVGYNGISEAPWLRRRAGMDWRFGLRGRYLYHAVRRISASAEYTYRAATATWYSYQDVHVYFDHEWRLPHGQYLLTHVGYAYRTYQGRDVLDGAGAARRDHRFRARLVYGVPLLTIMPGLPKFFDRSAITGLVETTINRSNIRNYRYTNWRFAIGLTKRFDF